MADVELNNSYLKWLKEGQPAAYERLAEQFEGPLFRYFLCDHRDHHVAEEQTAEVFAQLVRSLPTMEGPVEKLPAFVFTIARRVRARRWRRRRPPHTPIDTTDELHDGQPTPPSTAADREQLQIVLKLINVMETNMRDVFLLRFVEGYSINDVSAALSVPVGTVKSQIHRGRAQLRAQLTDTECQS